jgi:hypothetical protein
VATIRIIDRARLEKQFTVPQSHRSGTWGNPEIGTISRVADLNNRARIRWWSICRIRGIRVIMDGSSLASFEHEKGPSYAGAHRRDRGLQDGDRGGLVAFR